MTYLAGRHLKKGATDFKLAKAVYMKLKFHLLFPEHHNELSLWYIALYIPELLIIFIFSMFLYLIHMHSNLVTITVRLQKNTAFLGAAFMRVWNSAELTQPAFTCLELTIETLE